MRDPAVRTVSVPRSLVDARHPRRIVLLSDLHVAGPDMPPSRLARIVAQVNQLKPDLVLFAGDFVSDKRAASRHYSIAASVAPLGKIDRRAVGLAVPGNHDHWRDVGELKRELAKVHIDVLQNAVTIAGGVPIAGLDDDFTNHADIARTMSALVAQGGHGVVLSHSPDPFPALPPRTGLVLAGHTHCGQIAWPWGGAPASMSRYGQRYACGVVRESGNILITSAGLGTSVVPFRLFTQPEIWVIDIR